jgi:hypothetical protein
MVSSPCGPRSLAPTTRPHTTRPTRRRHNRPGQAAGRCPPRPTSLAPPGSSPRSAQLGRAGSAHSPCTGGRAPVRADRGVGEGLAGADRRPGGHAARRPGWCCIPTARRSPQRCAPRGIEPDDLPVVDVRTEPGRTRPARHSPSHQPLCHPHDPTLAWMASAGPRPPPTRRDGDALQIAESGALGLMDHRRQIAPAPGVAEVRLADVAMVRGTARATSA